MKTVSVDFDGVLHSFEKGWHDGSIYGKVDLTLLELLQAEGYCVAISTCRPAEQVGQYLRNRGVRVVIDHHRLHTFWNDPRRVLVTNMKVAASAYIDDRAINYRFNDYPGRLEEVVMTLVPALAKRHDGWSPSRSHRDPVGDPDDLYRHGDPLADALPPLVGDL